MPPKNSAKQKKNEKIKIKQVIFKVYIQREYNRSINDLTITIKI